MRKPVMLLVVCAIFLMIAVPSFGFIRKIGDVTTVRGVRPNQLIGYGLVVGLQGTGDSSMEKFTVQSIANMLRRMGVVLDPNIVAQLQAKNVAAVIVTATLPPFIKEGSTIDVTVSSIGDAKSLQGGTLLMTPLMAPNGRVYAVAQGALSIGGYNISSGGASARKNHATVGFIPRGAIVEREVGININGKKRIYLDLDNPSFLMSTQVADAINRFFKRKIAFPVDSGSVEVVVPPQYRGDVVDFIAQVNQLSVNSISKPVVVLDEKTGTVIIGGNVTVEPVSISHGNLTITIQPQKKVSQPAPLSGGKTKVVRNPKITVTQSKGKILSFPHGANVSQLVQALNRAGATPRDMMAIFEALQRAGALNARLEVM